MSWAITPADDDPFKDPTVLAAKASGGGGGTGYNQSAPTWLLAEQGGAQPPPPPPPGRSSTQTPRKAAAAPTAAELERQAKVPKLITFTRAVNMCLCIFIVVAAVFEILLAGLDFATGVLACYLFAFSCILCCFETHLKVVAKTIAANFGFLYNAKGRALFLVLIALVCFSLQLLLSYIAGALMLANAMFNFYVIFRYPEFERDLQSKQLESEGRDYMRVNRAENAQEVGKSARNNPNLAANVTGTTASSIHPI